jgi:hypothetical protein
MCREKRREGTSKRTSTNGDRNNVNAPTHSILFNHSSEHGALENM